jgi:D-alanyl-D-alanine carboxypeptidase
MRPSHSPTLFALTAALVAVATAAVVAGPVQAGTTGRHDPDRIGLQRDVDAVHAAGVTGVQARLVTRDGRQLVATAGVADRGTGQPVPPTGYFRIASTGKTFVATVALQLVAEGRLSLDDTVERWLPGVVRGNGNDGRRITVGQLLQHTSGIHDDFPDFASAADYYLHRYDVYTPEEIVTRAMSHPPDFTPGTAWGYSTTGYILADMIIERVTGRPWNEEVSRRIIRPLGLTHTFWPGLSPTLPQPHAKAYKQFQTDGLVDVTEQVIADPEGATISTTGDLNRFFRALLGGRLLPPAQLAEMKRTIPIGPDFEQLLPGARYGLGLFQRPLPCGGTFWSHPGGDAGYLTDDGVTADGRRSVAISMTGEPGSSPADFIRLQRTVDTLLAHALCG